MRNIGTVYFDKSTKGYAGRNRCKNRWRAEIVIDGIRYRNYCGSEGDGRLWCQIMYEKLNNNDNNKKEAV
jgi:hypothetical protein